MKVCPTCGRRCAETARVCPDDGSPLPAAGAPGPVPGRHPGPGLLGDATDPGSELGTDPGELEYDEGAETVDAADQATLVRDLGLGGEPAAEGHFLDTPTPVVSYDDVASGAVAGERTMPRPPSMEWITVPAPTTDPGARPISALIEIPTGPTTVELPEGADAPLGDPPTVRVPKLSALQLAEHEDETAEVEIEAASAPRLRPVTAETQASPLLVETAAPPRRSARDSQVFSLVPHDKRRFGRYVLLCRFASGGMADVFLATTLGPAGFEQLVAIKRIHEHLSADPEFKQMFLDEARLAVRVSHPNVVQVIELGRCDDTYFLAMEYVAGQSLRSLARRARLPYPLAARVISQVAAGLHAAHELRDDQGELLCVVHRDVSPGNILVSDEGAVKIADFGVARARSNRHTTSAGTVKGKFAYMAPEQATAQVVDRRTDVFALGVVLFEITTNHRLFKAPSDAATIAKILEDPIPAPSRLVRDYPPALEQIVLRALRRDPGERHQTAQELHAELEGYLARSGGVVAPGALGALVKRHFATEIATRDEIIARCKAELADAVGDYDELYESASYSLGGTASAGAARTRRRRVRTVALVAAAVGAAALAIVLALAFRGGAPPPEPPATPQRPADPRRTVELAVEAVPAHAAVRIAGRPVSNPAKWSTSRNDGTVEIVVSAPGYVTRRATLPRSQDGQLMVVLEREPPPRAPPRTPPRAPDAGPAVHVTRVPPPPPGPRRPPRRPPRPKKGVENLFSNPYDQ